LEQPDQQSAEICEMFQQQTDGTGIASDWLDVDIGFSDVGVAEMIGYYASFTDLLVVSQPLTAKREKQYSVITSPERLLLSSGRPVLIIPASGAISCIGERIMVASPGEGERLSRYLALHKVPADIELIPPGDLSVGDTLLNLVADDNIDLMVLGVHITTKRGQLDMGEISRYLLGKMTVPMLLSH
jgi:hypothetical protein